MFRYYVPFVYTERQNQPSFSSLTIERDKTIETEEDRQMILREIRRVKHLPATQSEIVILDWKRLS
jgi:hypothetical protein